MKRKLLSTLLALVLILSFGLVTALPVGAVDVPITVGVTQPTLTLNIVGSGTVFVGYGASPGANPLASTETYVGPDTVVLEAPLGTIVQIIAAETDPDFVYGSWTGDIEPHWFAAPGDDSLGGYYQQVTLDADKTATATFLELFDFTLTIEGGGSVFVGYGTPPGSNPMAPSETIVGPTTVTREYPDGTIIGLIAGWTDPAYMFDSWTGDVESHWSMPDAHAKQVTLNADKTATVTFEAKVISVGIDPSAIDFGTIMQDGTGSALLNVTNTGNVPASVTATLAGTAAAFYTANLEMDSGSVAAWSADLAVLGSTSVDLVLTIPSDATPGAKDGTIIFWAMETP